MTAPRLLCFILCLFLLVPKLSLAISPLRDVLLAVGFNAAEIQEILDGKLKMETVESSSEREIAVRFALLVKSPVEGLREMFMTSSRKKEVDLTVTDFGLVEGEGSLEDFDRLMLEPNADDMTKAYLNASPGTDLNLSLEEIEAFNRLNDTGLVLKQFREMLLNRLQAYRKQGLSGIAPYRRSGGKNYDPSKDLKRKTELAKILKAETPHFHRHLSEYPNAKPEGLEESFSWVNHEIDGKPTVALVHRMSLLDGDAIAFSERHFYVSRSHNCLQGVGGAFPVQEGIVVVYAVRTTTDQVSGFGSSAKRAIGARIMGSKMAENFRRLQESLAEQEL